MRHSTALIAAASLTAALLALGCGSGSPAPADRPKLLILGFDGMDPALLDRWLKAGQLPNIARLASSGSVTPLATTHSPESPTAWASFATGVNPGKHNIYDFLVRDLQTYVPDLGMVRREPPAFWFDWIPVRRPKVISTRGGTSFWVTAGHAGVQQLQGGGRHDRVAQARRIRAVPVIVIGVAVDHQVHVHVP